MKVVALLLALSACGDRIGYVETSQGIRIITDDTYNNKQCVFYDPMPQETEMAFEAVMYALYQLQLDNYYNFTGFDQVGLDLCFIPHAVDGPGGIIAGITYETKVFVALGRFKDRHDLKQTALTHEFMHVAVQRMCLMGDASEGYPLCSGDPAHTKSEYWADALRLANFLWGGAVELYPDN